MTREQKEAGHRGKSRCYGRVICRCETVTEAEIVEAVSRARAHPWTA